MLTTKLLTQGCQTGSNTYEVYGRYHDLVNPYNVAVSRIVSMVLP